MFDFLKLYPAKTSLFIGIAIGFCTYIVSTSLCMFGDCSDINPFFPLASLLGSLAVGIYCGWLSKGKLKLIIGFFTTLLTILAVQLSGARGHFDNLLGGDSILSHSLFYGVITLVFASAISLLNKSGETS
ncbi:MAG: hypothetical protein AAFQ63_20985 [Cyanobacteria bacterium J06621_11]